MRLPFPITVHESALRQGLVKVTRLLCLLAHTTEPVVTLTQLAVSLETSLSKLRVISLILTTTSPVKRSISLTLVLEGPLLTTQSQGILSRAALKWIGPLLNPLNLIGPRLVISAALPYPVNRVLSLLSVPTLVRKVPHRPRRGEPPWK